MGFSNHKELSDFFIRLGVTQSFYKMLAENDNSKQQLYLGGSFDVLQQLPFGEITVYPDNKEPNYKAPMDFYWINNTFGGTQNEEITYSCPCALHDLCTLRLRAERCPRSTCCPGRERLHSR